MTQGIWAADGSRFSSKKAFREAVTAGAVTYLEATSWFGNEYEGALTSAPDGTYSVVGPDPHRSRRWFALVVKSGEKVTVK